MKKNKKKDMGAKGSNFPFDILVNIPVGILLFDSEWKITFVNSYFFNFSLIKGLSKDKLLGHFILSPEIFNFTEIISDIKSLSSKPSFEKEIFTLLRSDGSKISVIVKGSQILNKGEFSGGILIMEDLQLSAEAQSENYLHSKDKAVAEEKQETEPDKEKTDLLEQDITFPNSILDIFPEPIIRLSLDGNIIYINEIATDFCGLTGKETVGNFCNKLFPMLDLSHFYEIKNIVLKEGVWEGHLAFFDKSSEEKIVTVRIKPFELNDVKSLIVLCNIGRDDKKSSTVVEKVAEDFRKIINISKEYIITFRPDGKIIFVNPYFTQEFKYTQNEILNLNFEELLVKQSTHFNNFNLQKLSEQSISSYEMSFLTKTGKTLFCQATFNAIKDTKGNVKYFNAILKDITNEKRAKNELLQVYKAINNLDEGILEIEGTKITLANRAFAELLEFTNEKLLLGKDFFDIIPKSSLNRVSEIISSLVSGNVNKINEKIDYLNSEGKVVTLQSDFTSLESLGKIFVNIKYSADKISSDSHSAFVSEDLNDFLISFDGFIWIAKRVGDILKVTFYSESVKQLIGYSSNEFLYDEKLWYKIIYHNDRERVVKKLKESYEDKSQNQFRLEYRIIGKNEKLIWIENKIKVYREVSGKINKIFGMVRDITYEKEIRDKFELYTKDLDVLRKTKDSFISIISHDLRTPFSSILGFSDLILNDKTLSEERKNQYVSFIKDASIKMMDLVNSLSDWIKLKNERYNIQTEIVDAKEVVYEVIRKNSMPAKQKDIAIVLNIKDKTNVFTDKKLLEYIFENLISNSLKFTNSGGKITVSSNDQINSRFVEFTIKDSGVGIEEEVQEKLFSIEKKISGIGTDGETGNGLGLILVKEIVNKLGGEITISSKGEGGTEVSFTIPKALEKILIVDDSKSDRVLYKKLLKRIIHGYEFIEAVNGKEALNMLYEIYPALIITDHEMPVMNGYEFVQQLNDSVIKYKPPIIVLSSDINNEIEESYKKIGVNYVFKKPVDIPTLKDALDSILKN